MTREIPFVPGIPNPVVGNQVVSDESGSLLLIENIIRYNGDGKWTCGFSDIGIIRPSIATYLDQNGILQTVGPNVTRDGLNWIGGSLQLLLREPRVTNEIIWSNDLTSAHSAWTDAGGSGTRTQNAVGLDGTPNSATTLTGLAPRYLGATQFRSLLPRNTQTHTVVYWVKKDGDVTRFPEFFTSLNSSQRIVQLNTKTGAFVTRVSIGVGTVRVIDGILWWLLEVTLQNTNGTGTAAMTLQISPAMASVIGDDGFSAPATGSIIVGHVDLNLNINTYTTPIITTTLPQTREADVFAATAGIMDVYYDDALFNAPGFPPGTGPWGRAKIYIPTRYRDEEGVTKNM